MQIARPPDSPVANAWRCAATTACSDTSSFLLLHRAELLTLRQSLCDSPPSPVISNRFLPPSRFGSSESATCGSCSSTQGATAPRCKKKSDARLAPALSRIPSLDCCNVGQRCPVRCDLASVELVSQEPGREFRYSGFHVLAPVKTLFPRRSILSDRFPLDISTRVSYALFIQPRRIHSDPFRSESNGWGELQDAPRSWFFWVAYSDRRFWMCFAYFHLLIFICLCLNVFDEV